MKTALKHLEQKIRNKKVGTSGDFSCFSFHAQKNLTTLGEGGAIYVKKKSYAKCVPGLRHNGHTPYKKPKKFYVGNQLWGMLI